jgi:kynurenine formamidase
VSQPVRLSAAPFKPSKRAGARASATAILALLCALAACAGAPRAPAGTPACAWPRGKLIELGHPFDQDTVYWPSEREGFQLTSLHHGPSAGGYFYAANSFRAPEHGGTHLDAPNHFAEARATTDQVPLERLIAPAVVVDISARAQAAADALLEPADLERFERREGAITPGTIVLVRTGWSARWPDKLRYLGSAAPGDTANLHFPGISAEAARLLVARQVAAVGIDTASIDHGPSREFWAHRILMGADIPAFENLAQLEQLPARGALVIALPMNIRGGSGGPLRAVAVLP